MTFDAKQTWESTISAFLANGGSVLRIPAIAEDPAAAVISQAFAGIVAERDALQADKLRLERAIIRLSAPDLLTQVEREALADFIKFMRDSGDDTVCQALGTPTHDE